MTWHTSSLCLHVARLLISLLCNDIITPPVSRLTDGPWLVPHSLRTPGPAPSDWVSSQPRTRRGRAGTRRARSSLGWVPRQRPLASLAQSLSLETRHNKRLLLLLVFWAPRHSPLTAEDLSQVGWYATGSGSFWIHLKFVTKFHRDNPEPRDIYDPSQDPHLQRVHRDINLPLGLWLVENMLAVRVGGGIGRLYRHDLSLCFSVMTCTAQLTKGGRELGCRVIRSDVQLQVSSPLPPTLLWHKERK